MVLVFKTNVDSSSKVKRIAPKFNRLFPKSKWNFDLEDCDCILRFESDNDVMKEIIFLMKILGYKCEAL